MATAAEASTPTEPRKDFFVSYSHADRAWAEWIGGQLEEAGYTLVLDVWDFRPGATFLSEMHRALQVADRTIPVLSPSYFESRYGEMEWTAALRTDALLPMRVRTCKPPGLLGTMVYTDLVGLDEDAARERVLAAVQSGRAKPSRQPRFPAAAEQFHTVPEPQGFPGGGRLVVDPHGHYTTIGAAIEAAQPGDDIEVEPGTYSEQVHITKRLDLIGRGPAGGVVIVHGSGGAAVWFEASAGRLANVTIEQVGRTGYGLDVAEGRLVVERCHISSRGNACVAIHGQAQVTVRASRIGPGHEGGIYISQTADAVLADNTVDGNGYHGVEVEHAAGLTMRGNTIFNNQQNGVRIWSTGRVLLEGNEVYQNGWEQVAIGGGSNPTLYRNVIRDGRRSGLYLGKTEGLIQDNTIVGNAASGVDLLAGSNATLRGNHINRNGNYAIWVQAGGGGTVTNNDLRGNDRETWSPGALHELQLRESQNDTDPP